MVEILQRLGHFQLHQNPQFYPRFCRPSALYRCCRIDKKMTVFILFQAFDFAKEIMITPPLEILSVYLRPISLRIFSRSFNIPCIILIIFESTTLEPIM